MMAVTQSKPADTALFDCLASQQRRAVAAALYAGPDELSERELAARVAARCQGTTPDEVSDDERTQVHVTLHHRDLPKLASVDLVEHDRTERRVQLADHPAFDDPGIRNAIESPSSEESVDALFEALADGRRQRILSLISGVHHSIQLREVAVHVAAHEEGRSHRDVGEHVVEQVYTDLWHTHLPKFQAADLVEYDPVDGTIAYDDHPDFRTKWLDSGIGGRFVDR